jgi:hypothetical protein
MFKIFIYAPKYDFHSGGNSILHFIIQQINTYSKFSSFLYPYNEETKKTMDSNLLALESFETTEYFF